ncbi:hypothetical protein H0O02_03310 [Candidatus Micrarchaeota archaeon]|nr:hypothetical protein [Candidatus Micrarchaeota archaeon]
MPKVKYVLERRKIFTLANAAAEKASWKRFRIKEEPPRQVDTPTENREKSGRGMLGAVATTAKKLWRHAILATPFLPACTITNENTKDNIGYYILGGVVLLMSVAAIVEVAKNNKKPGPEKNEKKD